MGGYYWGEYVVPARLAEPADLATWLGLDAPPEKADRILAGCTRLVLRACMGAFYDTDPATGLATDSTTSAAQQTATLIQAAAWVTLGVDPDAGGLATAGQVVSSTRLGSAQVVYADAADAVAARQAAARGLVPAALDALAQANLLGNGPWWFG